MTESEKRDRQETAQMAREVMKRMLESPPQTHEQMPRKRKSRKSPKRST